jgi:hypothetical protein
MYGNFTARTSAQAWCSARRNLQVSSLGCAGIHDRDKSQAFGLRQRLGQRYPLLCGGGRAGPARQVSNSVASAAEDLSVTGMVVFGLLAPVAAAVLATVVLLASLLAAARLARRIRRGWCKLPDPAVLVQAPAVNITGTRHIREPCVSRATDSAALNTIPASEVARRAGHGVEVLLRVYAGCIEGHKQLWNQCLDEALAEDEPSE